MFREKVPFDAEDFETAMSTAKQYLAGFNALWANPDDPFTNKVPLKKQRIVELRNHHFRKPSPMPLPVKIALAANEKPLERKGSLTRISPVEMIAAFFSAIAHSVKNGDADDVLLKWRTYILSCPFQFEIIEDKDQRHFKSLQSREDAGANYAGVRYTTLMKVFDIEGFMDLKARTTGKITAAQCATLYRENLTLSATSEPITDNFVDNALTISSRLLSIPVVRTALLGLDEAHELNNPLDGITKLHTIITKAKDDHSIEWATLLIIDFFQSGALKSDQVGLRALQGASEKGRGKGLVELMLYKREVLKVLLDHMNELELPCDVKSTLWSMTTSIATYRAKAGYSYNPEFKPVKKTFMAGWPRSSEMFFMLLDSIVFSYAMDDHLRAAIRSAQKADAFIETSPVSDELEAIEEALGEEGKRKPAGSNQEKVESLSSDDEADNRLPTSIEEMTIVKKITRMSDDDAHEKLEKFKLSAKNIVHANVELHPETLTAVDLARRLKDSAAGHWTPGHTPLVYRGVFYDPKVAGQSSAQRQTRHPPLRGNGDHIKQLIKMVIDTTEGDISPCDLFFITDDSKRGNHQSLLGGFTDSSGAPLAKQKREMVICYDEGSCKEQLQRVAGFSTLNQFEGLFIISKDVLKLNEHQRIYNPKCSNRGNMLGPLAWPEQRWTLPIGTKKKLLGRNGLILVGGADPLGTDDSLKKKDKKAAKKEDDETEPAFFFEMPGCLAEELIHGCDLCAGIDLTAASGAVAMEFLKRH